MQHSPFIDVEIDVRVEVLSIEVLMRPTAKQGLISKQVGNAGQVKDYLEERFRIDVGIKASIKRADRTDIFYDRFSSMCPSSFIAFSSWLAAVGVSRSA